MADTAGARARPRAVGLLLLVALLVLSNIALERLGPLPPAGAQGTVGPTGAWYCPHGGRAGWKGWVVVANPGDRPVNIRVTTLSSTGEPAVSTFRVGPRHHVYQVVPAEDPAASTAVEYFGGLVGAAAVLQGSEEEPGLATERCVAVRPTWFLADGTTSPGQTATVVVMNPFDADAAVDLTLTSEQRSVNPGPLSPLVVPAGSAVSVRLNDFVLLAPNEQTVAVQLRTRIGRVVAGSLGTSAQGIRAEAAVPGGQLRWNFPAGGVSTWAVSAVNPGDGPAILTVLAQGPDSQQSVPNLEEARLDEGAVHTYEVANLGNTATVIGATNGAAFVAAARLVEEDDTATVNGTARPYRRWLVLPGVPPEGGSAFVVLQNPTLTDARVTFDLMGEDGPVDQPALPPTTVPAGRAIVVKLPDALRERPISILLEAAGGAIVAASTSYPLGRNGFAVTLGLPLP